jgi:hypothetical protein
MRREIKALLNQFSYSIAVTSSQLIEHFLSAFAATDGAAQLRPE